jgi:hypothetical protein
MDKRKSRNEYRVRNYVESLLDEINKDVKNGDMSDSRNMNKKIKIKEKKKEMGYKNVNSEGEY